MGVVSSQSADPNSDISRDTFDLAQDVIVPIAQHLHAMLLEPCGVLPIMRLANVARMLSAVDFDHEFQRGTVKVGNVWAERMLSAEGQTRQLATAKDAPQLALGIGHRTPQSAATSRVFPHAGEPGDKTTPTRKLTLPTSPFKGEVL